METICSHFLKIEILCLHKLRINNIIVIIHELTKVYSNILRRIMLITFERYFSYYLTLQKYLHFVNVSIFY